MGWLDALKQLATKPRATPTETELIYIRLPEPLEPLDRSARYGDPLDAELQLAGLGYVSGGGSLLSDEDEQGERHIIFSGIDVDTTAVDAARRLLRQHLPALGCKAGSELQYRRNGTPRLDRYDGTGWQIDLPRSDLHPGFGI